MKSVDERRNLAIGLVEDIENVGCIHPKGAFYLYVDVSKITKDTLSFSSFLLDKYHVAAVPGEAFGTPGYLRISYAVDPELLKKGIANIKEAVGKYESK